MEYLLYAAVVCLVVWACIFVLLIMTIRDSHKMTMLQIRSDKRKMVERLKLHRERYEARKKSIDMGV